VNGPQSVNKFQEMLSYELWDDVFTNDNVNNIFNEFLNTYFKNFYSCFTKKKITPSFKYNPWITPGIRTSCKSKRELYLKYRYDNDPQFKLYYVKYCKVLAKVIKEAKKANYDSTILKSHNKIKTTWSIVKKETGYKIYKDEPQALKINNTTINNKEHIANAFNEYFTSVALTIIDDLNKDNNKILTDINPLYYLNNTYNSTFETIKCHYTSITDISKIIKSLD
jgi:hypothetical protein